MLEKEFLIELEYPMEADEPDVYVDGRILSNRYLGIENWNIYDRVLSKRYYNERPVIKRKSNLLLFGIKYFFIGMLIYSCWGSISGQISVPIGNNVDLSNVNTRNNAVDSSKEILEHVSGNLEIDPLLIEKKLQEVNSYYEN